MQSQEAEMVVRIAIEGMTFFVRIAGAAGRELLAMVAALIEKPGVHPGRKSLIKILRSGETLHIFAVPENRLAEFEDAAKRYGLQYCIAAPGQDDRGMCKVLVKASDAPRINFIIDELGIGTVQADGSIEAGADNAETAYEMSEAQKLMEDMMSPNARERAEMENGDAVPENMPAEQDQSAGSYTDDNRNSIREKLNEYRYEMESINDIFRTAENVRKNDMMQVKEVLQREVDGELKENGKISEELTLKIFDEGYKVSKTGRLKVNEASDERNFMLEMMNGPEEEIIYDRTAGITGKEKDMLQAMVDEELLVDGRISSTLSLEVFEKGFKIDERGRVKELDVSLNGNERKIIKEMKLESEELGNDLRKVKEAVERE